MIYLSYITGRSKYLRKCPFADFDRPKLDFAPIYRKKHCIGKQIFLVITELLNNAHHIYQMDLGDFPQIWK